jgi:hypothetical protein
MTLRWILFFWGSIAFSIMLAIGIKALLSDSPINSDDSISLDCITIAGIPAWLTLRALTVYNWRNTKPVIAAIHLAPTILAVFLYILA